MAGEVINLATFQLDTQKLQSNLSDLQDSYFDLRKEQKAYADEAKQAASQISILEKAQKALTAASGDNSAAIEANDKELQELNKTQREAAKSEQNLAVQIGTVKKEINQTTTQLRAYQDAEGKTTSLINLGTAALERQINNKNEARSANIALNNVANQLNPNIAEEAALLVKLNKQIDDNTSFITDNSSQNAKRIANIGNYTASVLDALRIMEEEKKALEGVKQELIEQIAVTEKGSDAYKVYNQQLNVLNVQINNFSNDISKAKGEAGGFSEVLELTNGGLGGIAGKAQEAGGAGALLGNVFAAIRVGILGALQAGLAFIATPIGATIAALAVAVGLVVGAFKLAKASLQSTEEGTQKLAVVTGAITGIFRGLFNVVKPLGLFFANVFIKYLETVGKVAENVANGLAKVLDFLGAESAAKGIRNFTNEVKAGAVAAANLARAEGELTVQQRQARKVQLDYQKEAEKLRQQRDDETKSISQRIAINNQLGAVLQKQSASELAIANKQLQVANLRIKAEGQTTDALNARAEAQTNISDIQERITGQESEQLANLNSLRKEAADLQKANDEKAIERALARSKAEIDLFVANQGFKKKSLEDEQKFNEELYNKEIKDLKLQFDKKKITQTQYDAQRLQLQNDYLKKNVDLTIANAELEIDAELEKNQRILDSDKFLSESQLALKQQALSDNLKAEQDFQKLRLENGIINEAEYNAEINRINEENRVANEELRIQRQAVDRERQLIDLENQKIAQEENFIAQAEIETQQNEIKRQQEITNAEQTGASIANINAKYAQLDKQIEEAKNENKLQLASSTFGNLAAIFGEESKAGKAAAIAQTTIDTYQAATAAYKSLAGIPIVGPALGGIAAAAAVVSGIANVKKITATKQPSFKKPSYASGVIGLRGIGTGTSDDIQANLSAGESIINARSTSMFARELSAINQAGGGVGINGTSNILNQNEIQTNANNSQMALMIAEAVAVGAEKGTKQGSQTGIRELSDDRKVMNDAKF